MAKYKVKSNQNIWDVSLYLYGTIEGVFDLLISNDWLTMTADLTPGMELEYHDYFIINEGIVSGMKAEGYLPANGERHIYHKSTDYPLALICGIPSEKNNSYFIVSGDGKLIIDWGDNTDLEEIELTSIPFECIHYFDNKADERRIRIYGEFNLMTFDTSSIGGNILPVRPITVDEFTSRENGNTLQGLFLFNGTIKLDLQRMYISDLSPIYSMNLQELNLLQVQYEDISVLDNYLQNIVSNYGERRNCTVYLDSEPSEKGMSAIQTIINEDSWNESGKWKFIINDKTYTKQ